MNSKKILKNFYLEYVVVVRLRDRLFIQRHNENDHGFTLIELLVVIIIIGILAAIALPSFLSQAEKAILAEAKTYISSASRSQQAYYLENQTFSSNLGSLGLGVGTETRSYIYSIIAGSANGSFAPPQPKLLITLVAEPKSPTVKALAGVVGLPGAVRIDTIFCIANTSNISPIPPGAINTVVQKMVCPTGFSLSE